MVGERGREPVREPRLADAARPEQREDAARLEQPGRELEVTFAPDERRALRGNVAPGVSSRSGRVPGRARGGRHPVEVGALFENRGFEIADGRRGFEAELLSQAAPELVRGLQCFGLTTGTVEREHELAAEAFPQRMVDE